jgi:DNA-binding CsgD family transcriptional regulator
MLNMEAFTDREHQIVCLLARGLTNKAIAGELRVAEGTVRVHVNKVFQKAGVHCRSALTAAYLNQTPPSSPRDLVALARAVAPDVIRITNLEAAGHITPPEADRLIEGLVSAAA